MNLTKFSIDRNRVVLSILAVVMVMGLIGGLGLDRGAWLGLEGLALLKIA